MGVVGSLGPLELGMVEPGHGMSSDCLSEKNTLDQKETPGFLMAVGDTSIQSPRRHMIASRNALTGSKSGGRVGIVHLYE